jgi:hypothetical protein
MKAVAPQPAKVLSKGLLELMQVNMGAFLPGL